MAIRTAVFYLALLLAAGGAAELYVRMKGIGENVQKVRGVLVARKPRLVPPIVFMIVAIIVAAATIPR